MSTQTKDYIQNVLNTIEEKHPEKKEYLQALNEVLPSLEKYIDENPEVIEKNILALLVEPERVIKFRVPWQDDQGKWQVNRGIRVQYNSALGPYKGGIRFTSSVNESVIRFLGFEQTFKNALTSLPIGGGKGGSDFDTHDKSEAEIMRFSQSFVTELQKHIGPDLDVPAGDIGVGGREVGYMYGQYKRLNQVTPGVFTGKPVESWGSLGRKEATGFGLVYIAKNYLENHGDSLSGKKIVISGAGNVSSHSAIKATELGATVIALSDSKGYLFNKDGFDSELFEKIQAHDYRLPNWAEEDDASEYIEGESVWSIKENYDIALPSATQNEIDADKAELISNAGVTLIAEGANMPNDADAIKVFRDKNVALIPGKAANAGGVAVSALEMSQNSMRLRWSPEEVDEKLKDIMADIYKLMSEAAEKYAEKDDLATGANIAGADRVIKAMLAQGLV